MVMNIQNFQFSALGTACEIQIANHEEGGNKSPFLHPTINQVYRKIAVFEQEFSRFRADSRLSLLNKKKSLEVSEDFLRLLEISKQIYEIKDGYFNPLFHPANIGYGHSFETGIFEINFSPADLNLSNLKNYGNLLELKENMELDFGGIAKGYLSEKISSFLLASGFPHHIANIGGDLTVRGYQEANKPWVVWIESPFELGSIYCTVSMSHGSLSTSGTYLRKWQIDGKEYHHIQSPSTLPPQERLVLVSVKHTHGAYSDALATALQSMGKSQAIQFAQDNKLEVVLISEDKEVFDTNKKELKSFLSEQKYSTLQKMENSL